MSIVLKSGNACWPQGQLYRLNHNAWIPHLIMSDLAPNLLYIVPLNIILHPTLNKGQPPRIPNDSMVPDMKSPISQAMHHFFSAMVRKVWLEEAILKGLDQPENKLFSLMDVFIYFHLKLHLQRGKLRMTEDDKSVVHEIIHWVI